MTDTIKHDKMSGKIVRVEKILEKNYKIQENDGKI